MRRAALLILLALAGCGSGGSGTDVSGSLGGTQFDMTTALFINSFGAESGSIVFVTTDAKLCEDANEENYLLDLQLGGVSLSIVGSDGHLVVPDTAGVYTLAPASLEVGSKIAPGQAQAIGDCDSSTAIQAVSGSVTLTHVELTRGIPTRLVGTVNLVFDNDQRLNGAFDAQVCTGRFVLEALACN